MRILKSKLYDHLQQQENQQRADQRKSLVGSGDRSQRIRTYNFPQSRVTDHRIGFTTHDLEGVLSGHLTPLLEALKRADQERQLAALAEG